MAKYSVVEAEDAEMLVELFDFNSSPETGDNWEETARWIKYEEDVEGLDKHWGRPHVAFLSFHALMQFRQYFAKGLLLFDPQVSRFSDILNRLAIGMVAEYGMDSATAEKIAAMLRVERHGKEVARTSSTGISNKKSTAPAPKTSTILDEINQSRKASPNDGVPSEDTSDKDNHHFYQLAPRKQTVLSGKVPDAPTIIEADVEEGEINEQAPKISINLETDGNKAKSKPSLGSIGRKHSKPLLRRLSTVIGIDALGGGHEDVEMMAELKESTHIYTGVIANMADVRIVMIRFKDPMRFEEILSPGMLPIRFIFVIIGPEIIDVNYHELGRVVATLMSNVAFANVAKSAYIKEQMITAIDEFMDLSVIVPPGDIDRRALLTVDDVRKALKQRKRTKAEVDELKAQKNISTSALKKPIPLIPRKQFIIEPEPVETGARIDHVKDALKRTKKPFGGVWYDIKYRAPYYFRDFKDALSFQCVTSALFMFCANFASAVAFGEVMGDKTDRYMGVSEILLAHGICGVIWGLIACQPLCIQAAVGPFLVFEASLYTFCKSQDVDFLAVRFWTALWTMVFMLVTTLVEGSFVMRYLTRFTEEIFTGLIAFIFIWEAFKFLYKSFTEHPVGDLNYYCYDNRSFLSMISADNTSHTSYSSALYTNTTNIPTVEQQPNTALMSVLLVLLTFVLTYTLKNLRHSAYFGRSIRKTLSDFAVPISVVAVIALYKLVFSGTYVQHLKAPMEFSLTDPSKRDWFVHPLGTISQPLPMWVIWASAVPALLVGILVFAEVEIIEMLIAKADRGLQRPHGFHWDLLVCSGLALGCSVFGLPWMCPAAVQSLSHVSSLTIMKRTAPGAAPKIDHVVEQRVTCIVVGLLHGAAAFAGRFLRFIPVPVLFGLFFYLGLMGLLGLQFVDRLVLAFMPQKYFPEAAYCRRVSVWRMHLFTLIQVLCFGILLTVNLISITALAFPFVLTLIAVFRVLVMPKIFQSYELEAIDGKGDEIKSESSETNDEIIDSEDGVDKKAIL